VDGGSYSEETLRANINDMQKFKFRQRILVDISKRQLSTTILGEKAAMPLILAPIGSGGLQYMDGEIYACRAAQKVGIPYTLSTMSICSIEDVAANVDKPFWFQLYMMKDRGFAKALIERAIAAKCSAGAHGRPAGARPAPRRRQERPDRAAQTRDAEKPDRLRHQAELGHGDAQGQEPEFRQHHRPCERHRRSWLDIRMDRLAVRPVAELEGRRVDRSIWPGKLIIKGILDIVDAREAVKAGAQAIVVSNHGGRQLDGAPSSISVLPEIVQDVGSQTEIMFDGGIRTGQDVMRALALGAKSCMIGRAYIYGLGAGGQAGVELALDLIGKELSTTMGLTGINHISEIDRRVLTDHLQTNA
jgi:L-lactate dehydrogenase (cytochrome)